MHAIRHTKWGDPSTQDPPEESARAGELTQAHGVKKAAARPGRGEGACRRSQGPVPITILSSQLSISNTLSPAASAQRPMPLQVGAKTTKQHLCCWPFFQHRTGPCRYL